MTERKYLLPQVDKKTLDQYATSHPELGPNYLENKLAEFSDHKDYMYSFLLKCVSEKNYHGISVVLVVRDLLEIAAQQQYFGELPVIAPNIAQRVDDEVKTKGEGFYYEMIERLREDNGLLINVLDRELNNTNDLPTATPALEMYRMLEIASEKQLTDLVANAEYLH